MCSESSYSYWSRGTHLVKLLKLSFLIIERKQTETDCTSLLPVLLFYSYQTGSSRSSLLFLWDGFFLSQKLAKVTRITETKSFHLIFWYVEDALSINNKKIAKLILLIYPKKPEINEASSSSWFLAISLAYTPIIIFLTKKTTLSMPLYIHCIFTPRE